MASLALQNIHALRETFRDEDKVCLLYTSNLFDFSSKNVFIFKSSWIDLSMNSFFSAINSDVYKRQREKHC